jgi:hypothetical protein
VDIDIISETKSISPVVGTRVRVCYVLNNMTENLKHENNLP